VNQNPEECKNCQDNADAGITGVVDITDELVSKGVNINDRDGGVVEYLKKNLKYAVKKVRNPGIAACRVLEAHAYFKAEDDAIVELPSLKITVLYTPLLGFPRGAPDEGMIPSPYTPYPIVGEPVEQPF
jgi:hypothetical protein